MNAYAVAFRCTRDSGSILIVCTTGSRNELDAADDARSRLKGLVFYPREWQLTTVSKADPDGNVQIGKLGAFLGSPTVYSIPPSLHSFSTCRSRLKSFAWRDTAATANAQRNPVIARSVRHGSG